MFMCFRLGYLLFVQKDILFFIVIPFTVVNIYKSTYAGGGRWMDGCLVGWLLGRSFVGWCEGDFPFPRFFPTLLQGENKLKRWDYF